MSSWKKRWKDELDNSIPKLNAEVLNAEIENVRTSQQITEKEKVSFNQLIAQFFSHPLRVCASVMVVCLLSIILFTAIIPPKNGGEQIYPYAFVVEINPAVALTTDEDGNVSALVALNTDADVVLSQFDEEKWMKKPVEDVIIAYADLAARLGFIDISSKKTAVHIIANKAENVDNILNAASIKLEEYFLNKGVYGVVLCEAVEDEKFSQSLGITAASNEQFINEIKSRVTFTFEDEVESLTEEQIKKLYEENVLNDDFSKWIYECIKKNLEYVSNSAKAIEEIVLLNDQIKNHPDNPVKSNNPFDVFAPRDYWAVKETHGEEISEELNGLMNEMEDLIDDYGKNYGVEIMDENTLKTLYLVKDFIEFIEEIGFDPSYLQEYFDIIAQIFEGLGIFTAEDTALREVPKTLEEYLQKAHVAIEKKAELRADRFEKSYNANYSPIAKEDYDEYIQSLINTYGSIADYWNAWTNGEVE